MKVQKFLKKYPLSKSVSIVTVPGMSAEKDMDECNVTELYFHPPTMGSMGDSKPVCILAVQIARARNDLTVYLLIPADDRTGSMSFIRPYSEHLYEEKVTDGKDGFSVENLRVMFVSLGSEPDLAEVGIQGAKSAYITASLSDHFKPVRTCRYGGKDFTKCFLLDFGDNSVQGGLCDLENVTSSPPVTLRFALKELNYHKSYFPPLFLPGPVNFS